MPNQHLSPFTSQRQRPHLHEASRPPAAEPAHPQARGLRRVSALAVPQVAAGLPATREPSHVGTVFHCLCAAGAWNNSAAVYIYDTMLRPLTQTCALQAAVATMIIKHPSEERRRTECVPDSLSPKHRRYAPSRRANVLRAQARTLLQGVSDAAPESQAR